VAGATGPERGCEASSLWWQREIETERSSTAT
jgi:hypothetical protein